MIILRRELGPIIYHFSIKIMVHLPLTDKKGRVKSMKKKSKYKLLYKLYPAVITKDQFYRICNISKNRCPFVGQRSGPLCEQRQENKEIQNQVEDVIEYLKSREKIPDDMLPHPDGTRPMVNLMRRIS